MESFVFNDETVINSWGFMVLNSGGSFDRFNSNPVMLHLHDQGKLTGKWKNLRVDGVKLLADPEFDDKDQFAADIQGKVERGFLRGASMGIIPLEAEEREIPGKGRVPVLTKWELLEGSTVPVPSNSLSLRLYSKDGTQLSSADEIQLSIQTIISKPTIQQKMEKINLSAAAATALNVANTEQTHEFVSNAIVKLAADLAQALADKKTAQEALNAHLSAQATALVDGAIQSGRLTADKKDSFLKLAATDFAQAKDVIDALPPKKDLSSQVGSGKASGDSRDDWNYMRWAKEDPKGLQLMAANDPDRFKSLREGYRPVN